MPARSAPDGARARPRRQPRRAGPAEPRPRRSWTTRRGSAGQRDRRAARRRRDAGGRRGRGGGRGATTRSYSPGHPGITPRAARADGLLPAQRRPPWRRAGCSWRAAGRTSRSSTGTCTTATAPRRSSATTPQGPDRLAGTRTACTRRTRVRSARPGEAIVNVPLPPGTGDAGYELAFERGRRPRDPRLRPPTCCSSGAGRTRPASDPLGRMAVTVPGFRGLDRARRRARRGVLRGARSSPSSKAATRCATCPPPTSRSSRRWRGARRASRATRLAATSRRACARSSARAVEAAA